MRVLLVEDDPELATVLRRALVMADVVADHVRRVDQALAAIASAPYDAVLLDRGLPDGDGLAFVGALRDQRLRPPVIILTARGDVADRIEGLDAGADDYLVKPFAIDELLARLRAVQRRPSALSPATICAGRLVFDLGDRVATIGGAAMNLPRRELLLLEVLVRRLGRTVQRAIIEEAVYGFDDEIQSNSLDAHVSRLRLKLSAGEAGVEIHGIRGIGYLLKPS